MQRSTRRFVDWQIDSRHEIVLHNATHGHIEGHTTAPRLKRTKSALVCLSLAIKTLRSHEYCIRCILQCARSIGAAAYRAPRAFRPRGSSRVIAHYATGDRCEIVVVARKRGGAASLSQGPRERRGLSETSLATFSETEEELPLVCSPPFIPPTRVLILPAGWNPLMRVARRLDSETSFAAASPQNYRSLRVQLQLLFCSAIQRKDGIIILTKLGLVYLYTEIDKNCVIPCQITALCPFDKHFFLYKILFGIYFWLVSKRFRQMNNI